MGRRDRQQELASLGRVGAPSARLLAPLHGRRVQNLACGFRKRRTSALGQAGKSFDVFLPWCFLCLIIGPRAPRSIDGIKVSSRRQSGLRRTTGARPEQQRGTGDAIVAAHSLESGSAICSSDRLSASIPNFASTSAATSIRIAARI
jgi:hypothetical protein